MSQSEKTSSVPANVEDRTVTLGEHDEFDMAQWTDTELVAAVAERRDNAFAELFRRHHRSVVASSRMILGNCPECDDVAADVFV